MEHQRSIQEKLEATDEGDYIITGMHPRLSSVDETTTTK